MNQPYDINKMMKLMETAPAPFEPEMLPLDNKNIFLNEQIFKLVSEAGYEIGEYNGFLTSLMNPMLLISPLINQEAVVSSKLEGTQATLEDVLNFQAGNKVEIEKDELQEILNYREALLYSLRNIATINSSNDNGKLPLSKRIITNMHGILLNNVRGQNKNPGQFKNKQNYIGSNKEITYTPVKPELTLDYMDNLEQYIHADELDLLIQTAIIHAQFEMIHPFEDGNGRIGRLLIPLFLYYREKLVFPAFYMSSYFEKDKDTYLTHLDNISKNNDWLSWVVYFLEGVIESSKISTQKAKDILNLYNTIKDEVIVNLNSVHGIKILDFMFSSPIFSATQASKETEINIRTMYLLLKKLEDASVLITNDSKRNKTYFFPQLLDIIN